MRVTILKRPVLVLIVAAATALAGCATPPEESQDPETIAPGSVYEEKDFNERVEAEQGYETSVAAVQETTLVEAVISLTDERANVTRENATNEDEGEQQPLNVTLRLLAPSEGPGNGENRTLLTEQNVTIAAGGAAPALPDQETTEEEVIVSADLSEFGYWDDYPDEAAVTIYFQVEVDEGPIRVVGHLRSFNT